MAAHTQGYCGWREGKQRDLRREGLDIDDKTGLPRSIKVNKGAHQGETFRGGARRRPRYQIEEILGTRYQYRQDPYNSKLFGEFP